MSLSPRRTPSSEPRLPGSEPLQAIRGIITHHTDPTEHDESPTDEANDPMTAVTTMLKEIRDYATARVRKTKAACNSGLSIADTATLPYR